MDAYACDLIRDDIVTTDSEEFEDLLRFGERTVAGENGCSRTEGFVSQLHGK